MEDFNEAVAIRTILVEHKGLTSLSNDLAGSLINRSIALDGLGKDADALRDLDKAVAIRSRLVEEGGQQDLANGLASALYRRAISLQKLDQRGRAIEDLTSASRFVSDSLLRGTIDMLMWALESA